MVTQNSNPSSAQSVGSSKEFICEVRFAVVMYGGVSLAIYINGIANQLLKMVESNQSGKVEPIYNVYREVGKEYAKRVFGNTSNCEVRLKVDVISGTSAGGINGIFLAKAIANNESMEKLKFLWIEEGDIEKLINDMASREKGDINFTDLKSHPEYTPIGRESKGLPKSLLSSDRMYRKLCEALYGMKGTHSAPGDLVDLFITTTNFYGRRIPIQLADRLVWEHRYKHVFHLSNIADKYLNKCGNKSSPCFPHFSQENIPFLAFAARSTSAFPFAFEAITFDDIIKVFPNLVSYYNDFFLVDNIADPNEGRGLKDDAFVDGGYLDNKPFSYAIDTISRRKSKFPVIRKMLYVEPSPEKDTKRQKPGKKPNAFKNALAAFSTLPRYETITEDIHRVQVHNNNVVRYQRIISDIEEDMWRGNGPQPVIFTDGKWEKLDLADMAKLKGKNYAAYQRLDVSSLTDYLANALCRAIGFKEQSAFFHVFRVCIMQWRDTNYVEYRPFDPTNQKGTRNSFLYHYNLPYHLRREQFIHHKIDAFFISDDDIAGSKTVKSVLNRYNWRKGIARSEQSAIDTNESPLKMKDVKDNQHNNLLAIRNKLSEIKGKIVRAYGDVPTREEYLLDFSGYENNLLLAGVEASVRDMKSFIAQRINDPEKSVGLLSAFHNILLNGELPDSGKEFTDLINKIKSIVEKFLINFENKISRKLIKANATCENVLENKTIFPGLKEEDEECKKMDVLARLPPSASVADKIAATIMDYYATYDDMDMIILPIIYGTDIGSGTIIDVHRVSPQDATSLVTEKNGIKKLAGTSFGDFGAFLEKEWRQSDMLWGELDGAETIIRSLIPNSKTAEPFISEAHKAILSDALNGKNEDEKYDILSRLIPHIKGDEDLLKKFANAVKGMNLYGVDITELCTRYNSLLEERSFRAARAFKLIARCVAVVSHMVKRVMKKSRSLSLVRRGAACMANIFLFLCRHPIISVIITALLCGAGIIVGIKFNYIPPCWRLLCWLVAIGLAVAQTVVLKYRAKIIALLSKAMP
jgi:patatin-related protein